MRTLVTLLSLSLLSAAALADAPTATLQPAFDRTTKIVTVLHGAPKQTVDDKATIAKIFAAIGAGQTALVGRQRRCPDDFQLRLVDAKDKPVGTIGFCDATAPHLFNGVEYEPAGGKRGAITVKDEAALQRLLGWPSTAIR